ncbi:MAG TPA: ATP-binding protein [Myxococcales bacterium]
MRKANIPRTSVALVLLLVAASVALWWRSSRQLASASEAVRHGELVEQRLDSLDAAMTRLESGARGYGLSGVAQFRADELAGERLAQERLADLRLMTAGEASQQATLDELNRTVDEKLAFSREVIAARDTQGLPAAAQLVASQHGLQLMAPITALLARMRAEEQQLVTQHTREADAARRRGTVLAFTTLGLLLLAVVLYFASVREDRMRRHEAEEATRRSEERMRLLLGAVRDYAIVDVDPRGIVHNATGATKRIFGRDPTGQHIRSLYPSDAVAAGMPERELETATREGRFEDEGPRLRTNGSVFWADVVTTAIRDDKGVLLGFAKILRDITDQKEIDDALRETARKLEVSNRELQDFAMIASHDLQEPLRKVQMFGDKLRRKYSAALGDEGRDWLTRMMNAAARGQSLIQGLLAFSRVTTKAQPPVPVDLGETAREVASDLEARIADVGGHVQIGRLPVIEADPLQMRQLLQNLIGNALKFRKPDEPPVVRVDCRTGPHNQYEIEVSDNGIGFDQKYVDRIFKLFQRLHERGTYEGSGMGLAICRKIVERHGGHITARSVPGKGTTFVIDLPAQQTAMAH